MNSINPDRENTELSQNFNGELPSSAATPSTAPATSAALNWIDALLDPDAFVIVPQRCLSAGEKRDLIAKLLKTDPAKSDRQIAETAKASPTTVGTVRAKLEAKGAVSKMDTRRDSNGRQQPATKRPRNATGNGGHRHDDRRRGADRGDGRIHEHPAADQNHVGANNQSEFDELRNQVRLRDIQIHALEGEVADLKATAAAETQPLDLIAIWENATDGERTAALTYIGFEVVFRAMHLSVGRLVDLLQDQLRREGVDASAQLKAIRGLINRKPPKTIDLTALPAADEAGVAPKLNGAPPSGDGLPDSLRRRLVDDRRQDPDGDDSIQGAEAGPHQHECLGDVVSGVFSALGELGDECRSSVDNAPPGISESERIQTLDETADALERLEEPDVPARLAEIRVVLPKHRKPRSRADRRNVALDHLNACVESLDSIDENDPLHDEAHSLRSELENASAEIEGCEFR
jgi:hypothetical protein